MKYLVMLTILCSCASGKQVLSDYRYTYKDKVTVTGGFYRGCVVEVFDAGRSMDNFVFYSGTLECKNESKSLTLIKEEQLGEILEKQK